MCLWVSHIGVRLPSVSSGCDSLLTAAHYAFFLSESSLMASTTLHGHEAARAKVRGRRRLQPSGYSDSEEEGDDDRAGEIMPKWKLYLAGAAIFLCFALLYPSVFSPMIKSLLGGRGKQQPVADQRRSPSPPDHHRGGQSPMPEGLPGFRPHMHPSAMRMPHAEVPPGGGGRGGFSWLLPFYTVGVVGFLLYTLSKIMFKPKKERKRRRASHLASWEGSEADEDEGDADDKQTRSMQLRLRKTEEAMKKILDQLEDLAHSPTKGAGNAANESGTQHCHGNVTDKLNAEQVKTMEKGLRELKVLSDLCKKQRAAVRDMHTSSSNTSAEDSDINDDDNDNYDCGKMAAEECVYEQAESSQSIGGIGQYEHDLEIKSTKEVTAEESDNIVGSENRLADGGEDIEEMNESPTQATVERTHMEERPQTGRSKARRRRQRRE